MPMNTASKLLLRLSRWLGALLVAIVVLWIAQQVFLKPVIEAVSTKVIGARVSIGSFSLNILTHKIRVTNLQIYNEQGFPPKVFFNASEILVDIDLLRSVPRKIALPSDRFSI